MTLAGFTCFIISPVWAQRALIFASTLGFIWCWTAGSESLSDSISELDWSRSSDIIKAPMNCADFTIITKCFFRWSKNGQNLKNLTKFSFSLRRTKSKVGGHGWKWLKVEGQSITLVKNTLKRQSAKLDHFPKSSVLIQPAELQADH